MRSFVIGLIASVSILTLQIENAAAQVLSGVDVLQRDDFKSLAGKRIGLITNQTGTNYRGKSTVELMHESKNANLVALFSPEHGFAGKLDQAIVGDDQDRTTGLKNS